MLLLKGLRASRSLLLIAVVGFLIWALLTGLMVEDRHDYLRRAHDWSRAIAVRGSGD